VPAELRAAVEVAYEDFRDWFAKNGENSSGRIHFSNLSGIPASICNVRRRLGKDTDGKERWGNLYDVRDLVETAYSKTGVSI
jgi:hypothetical protein